MANETGAGKRPTIDAGEVNLLRTAVNLWGYMWPAGRGDLKFRVVLAIIALMGSKVATTLVPFAYKGIIDGLGKGHQSALVMGIAVPVVLAVAYAVSNIIDSGFQQLRDVWFAGVGGRLGDRRGPATEARALYRDLDSPPTPAASRAIAASART